MATHKAQPVDPYRDQIGRQFATFVLRWIVSSFAMWACIKLFATTTAAFQDTIWTYLLAGLIFSLVNSIIKPFATLMSLPFIVFSLGLFVLIVNAGMVALTVWLLPDVRMDFGGALLSTITISIINYLANFLVPSYNK